jgi:hypothetical protein
LAKIQLFYQNFHGLLVLFRAVGAVDVSLVLDLAISGAAIVASAAAGAIPVHLVIVVIVMPVVVLLQKIIRETKMKSFFNVLQD